VSYTVKNLDELVLVPWRETQTGRVRHEMGIEAFGVNSWVGKNPGDRVIPEHAEDQQGDHDELYAVVRGRVRFEVDDDTFDAPYGTLVHIPAGPTRRTAFAEEPDTVVLAIGAPRGQAYEPNEGWEVWSRYQLLYEAGDYAAVIEQGREPIEQSGLAMPLYNLACCEALSGKAEAAIGHLRAALEQRAELRDLLSGDTDLDALRDEPAFQELVG
jgi:mannose-6-phosphate isomerase-like protein (cupin superfamily)